MSNNDDDDDDSKKFAHRHHLPTMFSVEKEEEDDKKVEQEMDHLEGNFPDSVYRPPPVLEEQAPDDLPRPEVEPEPLTEEWFCTNCSDSPCLFLQYQDELESHVDLMAPEATNK